MLQGHHCLAQKNAISLVDKTGNERFVWLEAWSHRDLLLDFCLFRRCVRPNGMTVPRYF